jgi:hypothetical protein
VSDKIHCSTDFCKLLNSVWNSYSVLGLEWNACRLLVFKWSKPKDIIIDVPCVPR